MRRIVRERLRGENELVDIPAYQRMKADQWRRVRDRIILRARELTGKTKVLDKVCGCGNHHAIGIYDEDGNLKTTVCPREYYVAKYLYYTLDPRNDPMEFVRKHDMKAFLKRLRIKEGKDGSRDLNGARGGEVSEDLPIQGLSASGKGRDPRAADR